MTGSPPPRLDGNVTLKDSDRNHDIGAFSSIGLGFYTVPGNPGAPVPVAVKILRVSPKDENSLQTIKRRLDREAKLWIKLDHPNILPFYGLCGGLDNSGVPSLISPYMMRGNAAIYVKSNPEVNTSGLVLDVCKGLVYLHRIDAVHGDLKCSNVLIGDDGHACLCDFGQSRILEQTGYTTELKGTARYMAPELLYPTDGNIADFNPRATKESDVFGFSMVSFELLSGDIPYRKISKDTVITFQVVHEKLRPSKEFINERHHDYWPILVKCWEHDSGRRPTIVDVESEVSPLTSNA